MTGQIADRAQACQCRAEARLRAHAAVDQMAHHRIERARLTEVTIEAQLKVAERPETADRIAAFKKNLCDALLKKGFSGEQATQITLATSPPSAAPMSK